jgi:hypothetical protein
VAIEKRKPDEEHDEGGTSIDELIALERVDELAYMGWTEQLSTTDLSLEPESDAAHGRDRVKRALVCAMADDEERDRTVYFHVTVAGGADEKLRGKSMLVVGLSHDKITVVDPATQQTLVRACAAPHAAFSCTLELADTSQVAVRRPQEEYDATDALRDLRVRGHTLTVNLKGRYVIVRCGVCVCVCVCVCV